MNILSIKNKVYFAVFPTIVLFLFFILPLVTCPLWGQAVQKKSLTASHYDSFGHFVFHKPSEDGNWSCFSMFYKNGKDTLYLKNTFSKKIYSFPIGSKPDFLGNNHFIYQTQEGLHILDLQHGHEKNVSDAVNYSYSKHYKMLVVLTKPDKLKKQQIIVMDLKGRVLKKIENAGTMKISSDKKKLLFTVDNQNTNSIGILELGPKIKTTWISEGNLGKFKMLTWEKKGRAISFLNESNTNSKTKMLYYYVIGRNHLYCLDPKITKGFISGTQINERPEYTITISDDLQRVFLGIDPINEVNSKSDSSYDSMVEIWNSSDKYIFPMMMKKSHSEKQTRLAVWQPFSNFFMQISSAEIPKAMLSGNGKYAILSNPKTYEPQFQYDAPRDFYIMNLLTGKKKIFLQNKKISPSEPLPVSSPDGKYISYMLQDSCWIYNTISKKHINITRGISENYLPELHNKDSNNIVFMPVGWTRLDKQIVLYDGYDLWTLSPQGSNLERLTHGRKKQIKFRIYEPEDLQGSEKSYDGWISKTISLSGGLMLKASGEDGKTGFFKWTKKTGEIALVYDNFYIDKLYTAAKNKILFYQQQKFDQPPKIMVQKEKSTALLFQSSPNQAQYHWGSTALIKFENEDGKKMQSLLYYPAGYEPGKKYPMIVNIYEKQTQNLYRYCVPELENEAGFNPAVFTNQGYFVLCPDILSEKQNEGPSALYCTISAVKEIIKRELIFPDKIGLIGHSFGGYESVFILTQTNIFTAAVAGAAITNISSYYYTVDWDTGRPTMNYFINGQLKMIDPPSEKPEVYTRNSPIEYVQNVTTPLLSYAGKEDNHVDWHQTLEFHMALRRLGRNNTMLLYPNEGHTITNPVNQRDLTQKISQWFGYYLKNEKPEQWMEKN